MLKSQLIVTLSALAGILVLVFFIYQPALNSPFYLDDFLNLSQLKDIPEDGYIRFIFGGIGFPGRPISLFTFAVQYESWPDNPYNFKLVNLLIHLLNGVLIFIISSFLLRKIIDNRRKVSIISLIIVGVWLIHPMHLTTTLYVIQRMTLLSTFFVLLGLAGYLFGRQYYEITGSRYGLLCMAVSITACVVLAILSKESGVLLPLFVLIIEWTIFGQERKTKDLRIFLWLFAAFPLFLFAIYLSHNLGVILNGYLSRDFSMSERLMTETRIIFIYLENIFLPRAGAYSLFNDDIEISKNLLTPVTTLISITGILLSLICAVLWRKKYQVLSFAILWFLGGHLLESTFLNLELYFEHRNYLPSFGLIFGLVYLVAYCWRFISNKILASVIFILPLITTITVTVFEITSWKNPVVQAHDLVRRHPESGRAINNLGQIHLADRNWSEAIKTYEYYAEIFPRDLYPHLRILHINSCALEEPYSKDRWEELYALAKESKRDGYTVLEEIDGIVADIHKDICEELNMVNLASLILTLMQNPDFMEYKGLLHEHLASISLKLGDARAAVLNINEAVRISPLASRHIYKIQLLIGLGQYEKARLATDEFKDYLKSNPKDYLAYGEKYKELKDKAQSTR